MSQPIQIAVSACLLGEKVRYDGGHKRDAYVADVLSRYFRLVPVCPEHECGLGIPREPIQLEGDPAAPRLVTVQTRRDLTARMSRYCERRGAALATEDVDGFILKSRSPSCGLRGVRIFRTGGRARSGRGLFAAAVARRFSLLPLEDEGRLEDPALRENFVERLFARRRLRDLVARGGGVGALVEFHARHELQLMAHHPVRCRELGRLVASGKRLGRSEMCARYQRLFMAALATVATPKKNSDVLLHIAGLLEKQLGGDEKIELLELIDRHRRGLVPLLAPLTLLKHYVRVHRPAYLEQQTFLDPHPGELMLRNRV
ncbi:MAG: DUF1722 domain-containing protein [Deltaproteobacteria bacterium]|nr:DUF1722 domain-containing protein [Deltaproteobacteria bacterium]